MTLQEQIKESESIVKDKIWSFIFSLSLLNTERNILTYIDNHLYLPLRHTLNDHIFIKIQHKLNSYDFASNNI